MLKMTVAAVVATVSLLSLASPASAASNVDVDGGVSHLPALSATGTYWAGPTVGEQIRAYRASGKYESDRKSVVTKATKFLDSWLKSKCAKRTTCHPAIVFDFDDTLISWYEIYDSTNFLPDSSVSTPAMNNCTNPAIAESLALLSHAQAKGVQAYVITGRTESSRAITQACMDKIGIKDTTLILRQPDQANLTAVQYKSAERAAIQKSGKRIVLSIGDQFSDVTGGSTAGQFVLPNPVYFIP